MGWSSTGRGDSGNSSSTAAAGSVSRETEADSVLVSRETGPAAVGGGRSVKPSEAAVCRADGTTVIVGESASVEPSADSCSSSCPAGATVDSIPPVAACAGTDCCAVAASCAVVVIGSENWTPLDAPSSGASAGAADDDSPAFPLGSSPSTSAPASSPSWSLVSSAEATAGASASAAVGAVGVDAGAALSSEVVTAGSAELPAAASDVSSVAVSLTGTVPAGAPFAGAP